MTREEPSSDWMACTLGLFAATEMEDLNARAATGAVLGNTAYAYLGRSAVHTVETKAPGHTQPHA